MKLISKGVRELLQSPEITESVRSACQAVEARAGSGYSFNVQKGKRRAVGRVYAFTDKAYRDNKRNNTLLKALHD